MKVILIKLLRDFRRAKLKLMLMILAAGLSSWGISSMLYSYVLTNRDFEENFIETNSADMALTIENFTPGLEKILLEVENIDDLEIRQVITGRVRDNRGSWMPLTLFIVDDIGDIRYDKFTILDKANRTDGKVLIEQNAFFFLNALQDSLQIQFQASDSIVNWKLNGKVHDARLAPARMEGVVYGYSTSEDLVESFIPVNRKRILLKTTVSDDKEALEQLFEELKQVINSNEAKIVSYTIPEPGKHIHQGVVDGIAFLQEGGGISLAIMGTILLSLILLTWIFPQITEIGVMKSLGANSTELLKSYLAVLILIILIGICIGLPVGYITSMSYSRFIAYFQNFIPVTRVLPLQYHLLVFLLTLTIPILFGAYPLIKSVNASAIDAMTKTFYSPLSSVLQLSKSSLRNPYFTYGLNNLLRHTTRTICTVALIGLGITLYFTSTSVEYSIREDMDDYVKKAFYEIGIILPEKLSSNKLSFFDSMDVIQSVGLMNVVRANYLPYNESYSKTVLMRKLTNNVIIPESHFLRGTLAKSSCETCIYVSGEEMRKDFQETEIGDWFEIKYSDGRSQSFKLAGVIKDQAAIPAGFFVYDTISNQSIFNGIAVELGENLSEDDIFRVSNQIDDQFLDRGISLRSRISVTQRADSILNHLDPTFLIIKLMGLFTVVLGLMGLFIVLNLTIEERTRDIGIIKALGAPFRKISRIFILEFLSISLVAILIGAFVSIPIAKKLISTLSGTVIGHPVLFQQHWIVMMISVLILCLLQVSICMVFNRLKMKHSARELLDHQF